MINVSRRSAIEPFHAMDVLAKANQMKAAGLPVISMTLGQPSDPAPLFVRRAAQAAIATGNIGYTDALGLMELRLAISEHYQHHYGLDIEVERIVVTSGSSAGFNLAFLAMFDVGDRVAITRPGYPAYRNIMKALGLEVIEIPVGFKDGHLTAERLAQVHAKTPLKGLLFASPANPTGQVMAQDEIKALVQMAHSLGISVISDEIYHRLCYVADDWSALAVDETVVVINSFSKYYCMTGWRIGWMVLPKSLVRSVERIAQSLYISASEVSQRAALAAFDSAAELDVVRGRYLKNRDLLTRRLPDLGFPLAAPLDGAFYAWCDATNHTNDSMEFAHRLLNEAHVAATPGLDFDPLHGQRFIRFSYSGSYHDIELALERIERFIKGR